MPETKEKKDDEDLETWAMRLWRRMDRDGNSFVTRSELDSEEFRSIIRSVLTPAFKAGNMGGVEYMRSELNMTQAIHYCLRKADLNGDNALSYLEFRSFLRVLRHEDLGKSTAHLIFALFDLDQDGHISESEFREVFRFYQGHRPSEEQFQKEWAKLDARGEQRVNIAQYVKWLRASKNPIFHQHAPPEPDEVPEPEPPSPDMRKYLPRMTFSKSQARPKWNQRFNAGVNKNDRCPQGQRSYFSKTQSLPELQRFYETHRGFNRMAERLTRPEAKAKPAVLSNERNGEIYMARSEPGSRDGWMRHPITGRVELWEDHWQTPKCIAQFYQPGTIALRCPGEPPKWMYGEEEDT